MEMSEGYTVKRIRNVLNADKIIVDVVYNAPIDYITFTLTGKRDGANES